MAYEHYQPEPRSCVDPSYRRTPSGLQRQENHQTLPFTFLAAFQQELKIGNRFAYRHFTGNHEDSRHRPALPDAIIREAGHRVAVMGDHDSPLLCRPGQHFRV